jgi:hypothetical protein
MSEFEIAATNGHVHDEAEALPETPAAAQSHRLIMLTKERPSAWAMMPEAIARVKRFCVDIASDYPPAELARVVETHFASDKPLVVVMVGIGPDGAMVGHIVASIETWGRRKVLVIMQYDKDGMGKIPIELLRAGLESIEEWGRMHGCEKTRVFALNETWARGLEIFYGFKRAKILMERDL